MNSPDIKIDPPYARQIDPEGMVMIYCGRKAWRLAAPGDQPGGVISMPCTDYEVGPFKRVASLVFPRGADPAGFKWPVKGRQVMVLGGDAAAEELDLLAIELLRAGAFEVHVRYSELRLASYLNPNRVSP